MNHYHHLYRRHGDMGAEAAVEEEKPQCGSGTPGEDYDLPLHVGALFLVLAASIIGCGFPVIAKKFPWMKIPPKLFFFCKHFGTGVLIATAFVHLLPVAFGSLSNPCLPDILIEDYPAMPGVIMMGSLFCLFCIELWLNHKTGGHSHGGPTGAGVTGHGHPHGISAPIPIQRSSTMDSNDYNADQKAQVKEYSVGPGPAMLKTKDEIPSEMPAWFIVFYEQYIRQRDEMLEIMNRNMPVLPRYKTADSHTEASYFDHDVEEQSVDAMTLRKMNLNITMLEGGILFHSIFVGMTISITTDGFIVLLVAIVFHQMFEGLGLGSRIAEVPYAKSSLRPWVLVVAFGTTAPIGQAIGILTRDTYDPESAFGLIIVGVFNAISSGLLIYAALVDLLAEDFLSHEASEAMTMRDKIVAFSYLLMGAAGMSIVGAFA